MPGPEFRENYYAGQAWPTVVKSVTQIYTSTTAVSLWTPATGKKFKILGGCLTAHVGVVLAGNATDGDYLLLYDGAATVGVHNLGVIYDAAIVAGSTIGTGLQSASAITTAATAGATANVLAPVPFHIPGGYVSAAANNVLKAALCGGDDGAVEDVGSGTIVITGTIWGHEV
jgi:hypothetical protein